MTFRRARSARPLLLLGALLLVAACAGRGGAEQDLHGGGGCAVAPEDSAYLAEISATIGARVYDRCEVDRSARRLSAFFRRPTQTAPTNAQPCLEAALEFVVGPDGKVLPAPIQATATNSPPFAREIVTRYREWRFAPALRDGEKVRQLVRDTAVFALVPTRNGRPLPSADRPRCNRY